MTLTVNTDTQPTMQAAVLQEALRKAVERVAPFVARRNQSLPVVENIALAAHEGMLVITGTDLSSWISHSCGAQIAQEGGCTVPKRVLVDSVKSLPKERIDLAVQGSALLLTCAGRTLRLDAGKIEDYPPLPVLDATAVQGSLALPAPQLREIIRKTVDVAATDPARPVLTGVHVSARDGTVRFMAADGFRLAVYTMERAVAPMTNWQALLPAEGLAKMRGLLKKEQGTVDLAFNERWAMLGVGYTEVYLPLIDGTFPNYPTLIPTEHTTRVELLRKDFLQAVNGAAVYARGGSGSVRLHITKVNGDASVTISARAEEVGTYEEHLSAVLQGAENKIAFNIGYLQALLAALDDEVVVMEMAQPSSPAVWGGRDDPRYLQVIMPMFVEW